MLSTKFFLAAAVAATPFAAVAEPWSLDPMHATINFSVDHFGFSDVHGQFRKFDGEIDFDPENVEATEARFVIDVASFDTNLVARDEHIMSADFLDVENFPEIVFVSQSVSQTGEDTADITGEMTVHGVTKTVVFFASLNKIGDSPFDPSQKIAGFTITGEIDRTEFGIDAYAPAIGAILPVTINFEMSPSDKDAS